MGELCTNATLLLKMLLCLFIYFCKPMKILPGEICLYFNFIVVNVIKYICIIMSSAVQGIVYRNCTDWKKNWSKLT